MNISKTSLAYFAFALALSACDEGKGPGNPEAYQGKDGVTGSECTQKFLDEYNDVAQTARFVQTDLEASLSTSNRTQLKSDAQALKDKATAFQKKYAGVVCLAKPKNGRDEDKVSLDVDQRMKTAIEGANDALAIANAPVRDDTTVRVNRPAPSSREQCSSSFLTELSAVEHYAQGLADELNTDTPTSRAAALDDARTLKEKALAFKARYPGYKCDVGTGTGSSRFTVDVDSEMDTLVKAADDVTRILNGGGRATDASHAMQRSEPALEPMQAITR